MPKVHQISIARDRLLETVNGIICDLPSQVSDLDIADVRVGLSSIASSFARLIQVNLEAVADRASGADLDGHKVSRAFLEFFGDEVADHLRRAGREVSERDADDRCFAMAAE
jgi:hypothetical protein